MRARFGTRKLVSMSAALLALTAGAAFAVPPSGSLEPANNYGTVSAQVANNSPGRFVVCFTVTDTSSYYGIKGLIVYGPQPTGISSPPRTQTTLYQRANGYSWWDANGGPDNNGDGLPDSFIAPGQTVGGTTFCLTYSQPFDLSTLSYGLHVVEPFTGKTFFAHTNVPPPPSAKIAVQVLCGADSPPHPIAGATVQLISTVNGSAVASGSTDSSGQYVFSGTNITNGGYYVAAQAANYQSGQSSTFTYAAAGADVSTTVTLVPAPINYLSTGKLTGSVFFSDVQTYRDRQTGSTVLTQADLYSSTYASADFSHSYLYQGTIPSFPELGSFGGPGQPQIWVIIGQPLVPETQWNDSSLTNFVAVEGGLGTGAGRARSAFTVKLLFSQLFFGSGSVFFLTIGGLVLTPSSISNVTWSLLPAVQVSGAPAPTPPAGMLPPGWMARTRFQFSEAPGVSSTAWAVGSYNDICGQSFSFRIEPTIPAVP